MDTRDTAETPVRKPGDSLTDRVGVPALDRQTVERHLWAVAVLALVADVHLTWLGLQHGIREGNPVVRLTVAAGGIGAFVLAKFVVLGIAALVRKHSPRHGPVIALGLAIPWAVAAAINAVILA